MKTVYNIDLSVSGINELQQGLRETKTWLKQKTNELCQRLADMGVEKAELNFSTVIYDGIYDFEVHAEPQGNGFVVKASGEKILFIEFGTGLGGFGHPESNGYGGGTYPGKGNWDNPKGWWYSNEDGSGHHSYGNPPNMSMYNTVKDLEMQLEQVVREVFST